MLHSSFLLAISFTHGSVYVSTTLNSSHPLFPHCFHKSILYVCISVPALQIGSAVPEPYRLHIYVLKYDTCFSLSDLLHSVTRSFIFSFYPANHCLVWEIQFLTTGVVIFCKNNHPLSSVAQSCPTLCDPMNYSTSPAPGVHPNPCPSSQ